MRHCEPLTCHDEHDDLVVFRSENFPKAKCALEALKFLRVLNPRRQEDQGLVWVMLQTLAEYNLLLETEIRPLFDGFCASGLPPGNAVKADGAKLNGAEFLAAMSASDQQGGDGDARR